MVDREVLQRDVAETAEEVELKKLLLEVEKYKEETPVVSSETGRKRSRYPEGRIPHY